MSRAASSIWWLSSLLLLAACGFQPLYGKQEPASRALVSGIKIDQVTAPDRRTAQLFRINLEDQINPEGTQKPIYRLSAGLSISEAAIGTARDGTVSRYNIYLTSAYTLTRISDHKLMTAGELRHASSYNNITNEYYSTYVSKEDAIKRGLMELSQLYRQRLGAYVTENGGNPSMQKAPPPTVPLPSISAPSEQNQLIPSDESQRFPTTTLPGF